MCKLKIIYILLFKHSEGPTVRHEDESCSSFSQHEKWPVSLIPFEGNSFRDVFTTWEAVSQLQMFNYAEKSNIFNSRLVLLIQDNDFQF